MANKVLLKKSSVAAKAPVAGDLDYGEVALNYTDGKLYFKKADNTIDYFATGAASAPVLSVGGYTGDVTATNLLDAIKTVDGTGSGLDADTLDGNSAAAFYLASNPNGYTSNTGTVTSVGATAPVVSSGGNTPTISMAAATATVNGYMTSTYAAKLDGIASGATANTGTVTSVAMTVPTGLSISGSPITSSGTLALSYAAGYQGYTTTEATKLSGIAANANNYSLPIATSTVTGGIELFSDTVQSVAANAVSATASRTYGIQLNAAGQAVVNVPWSDTNSGGTVTSVSGTGTVSGLTLTGSVTSSGSLTLGGTLSLTSANVTTALGFTPYNATNPNGYITSSGSITGSAVSLLSPNGATVVSGDATTAMPSVGQSFIHTLGTGPSGNDGHILGMSWANTTTVYGAQIWMDTDPTSRMAIRSRSSAGVWNSWSEVLSSNNYNSYSPTLTGGGASGTWGISITGSASTATNSSYSYNYTQGFNSNWNTDFQAAPAGSMILRGDTSSGSNTGGPGGSWWFQQNFRHTNSSNYWGTQVAWGWEDNANILRTRNVTGGSYGSWVTYLNSSNYTSYAVSNTYNSSLNSDSRNSRGVTRLYRNDSDSDYSVQTYWTGARWRLYGYNGDTGHADTHVGYADTAGNGGVTSVNGSTGAVTISGGQYLGTATVKSIEYFSNTISENITIAAGTNGLSAGPITIATGNTVTVATGAVWVIV